MGDPKKSKKTYKTPSHPWNATRIAEERIITKEFGLQNKKEIWKADSYAKKINIQAKRLIRDRNLPQAVKEQKQLLERLNRLGLTEGEAQLDDVLALTLKDVLNRRLQTLVHKKGLALSSKQSRQFIVHGHISIFGSKVTVPGYLVTKSEEESILFNPNSSLSNEDHAERLKKKKEAPAKVKELKEVEVELKELKEVEKIVGEVIV